MSKHEEQWPQGLPEGESIEIGPDDFLQESEATEVITASAATVAALGGAAGGWAAVQSYRMQRKQHEDQPEDPDGQRVILPPHVKDDG